MRPRCSPRGARLLGAAVFLAAAVCVPSWGLDLVDGRVKLTLHGGLGRFSLAWQAGSASDRFVPLLASEDPRTSMLTIVAGNRVYTMGESPEFSETVEKTASGARFTWKSSFLQVTEAFSFIPAAGSTAAAGVRIDLTLKNLSNQNVALGARYLFDTYLGESSHVHFRTDTLSQVTHELVLVPADATPWWVSPLPEDPGELGFQVMLAGQDITSPDRVVFANWKRLTSSSWSYEASTVRTFSLLPYSVNDSAASQYYEPRVVARGEELVITLAVGKFSRAGLTAAPPAAAETPEAGPTETAAFSAGSPPPQAKPPAAEEESPEQKAARANLSFVDSILAEIDAAIASGTPLTAERLADIQAALKELSNRSAGTSPGSDK